MLELIIPIIGIVVAALGLFFLGSAIIASLDSEHSSDKSRSGIRIAIILGSIVAVIGIAILVSPSFITVVEAGNVGVQSTFGVVDSAILEPGLHIKNPFTQVIQFSTRTTKYMDYGKSDVATIVALSNDGLETTMEIAVNYHINPVKAPELYKQVGTDVEGIIMVNPIHSVPRDMISKYDTKTLYSASQEGSTDRAMLERELFTLISDRINDMGVKDSIIIEQVSIRKIDFVQTYKESIAAKMTTDTEIAQKKLEVQKQKMEAERVAAQAEGEANKARIDAQGKADAQRIEAQGIKDASDKIGQITQEYLNLYFMQTMKDNPRAIYIPVGENGLPMYKNVDAANP